MEATSNRVMVFTDLVDSTRTGEALGDVRALARDIGRRVLEARLLGNLGNVHGEQNRYDEARSLYRRALAIHREVSDRLARGDL
jgi:hypothetical protein